MNKNSVAYKFLRKIYIKAISMYKFFFPPKQLKEVLKLEKAQRAKIRAEYRSAAEDSTDSKKTVIVMFDGKIAAGGLCDRLRGAVSIYQTCKKMNIDFKLHFVSPFKLQDFIEPNSYNWLIDDNDIKYTNKSVPFFLYSKKDDTKQALIQQKKIKSLLKKNYSQFHLYTNAHYSLFSDSYAQDFNELFKPTAKLQIELNKYIGEHKEYVSVSFRFMQLLGDFDELYKNIYTVLPESDRKNLISKTLKLLEKLYEKEQLPIFVATDSKTILKESEKLPFTFIIPGVISHVDAVRNDSFEANKKTFIDFYMIANASKVYCAHSSGMHYSGFPKNAALSADKEFEIVEY